METKSPVGVSVGVSVRAIKQSRHYFLKQRYSSDPNFTKDFGLSFQPHEIRIRSITCMGQAYPRYEKAINGPDEYYGIAPWQGQDNAFVLHMEGIGDICSFTQNTDRVVDYAFKVRSAIDGQQNFQVRDVGGNPRESVTHIPTFGAAAIHIPVDLVIHMEFIEFV